MKVLITGGSGMLGKALICRLQADHEVAYTVHRTPADVNTGQAISCDLTDERLDLPAFDAIIHTAALTDVDYCQGHPEEAYRVNVLATRNLVRTCPGAYFVYISTDFVFDGEKGRYTEEDAPNPISEYGRTKYQAEKEIPASGCSLRTSIYGLAGNGGRPTFLEKMLTKLASGQEILGFDDQWFSPISIYNLSDLLAEILVKHPSGVIHLGGTERVSKYQFMNLLAGEFGYPQSLVKPNKFEGHTFAAPRPRDASLDVTKAKRLLETRIMNPAQSFKDIKQRMSDREMPA